MALHLSRSTRLSVVIGISTCFFLAEISLGFYTHSIALVADAFHYLNDLVGFIIALVALKKSERSDSPKELTFGWQRAQLLGAFFNGVLLFGLGISIFLQSIERFIALQRVHNPKLMFIIGCVGLGLNIISAVFLHEHGHGHGHEHSHDHSISPTIETPVIHLDEECHDSSTKHHDHKHVYSEKHHCADSGSGGHSHGHGGHDHGDLGMMGVMIHVIGDAINNLGVMAAGLIIWLAAPHAGRYYADPGVSMFIAILIILSSFPLMRRAGLILLESVPAGVDMCDVKHDLEKIKGVNSIHELHIWRLNQQKTLASVHVVVSENSVKDFMKTARVINECFHAYGIHSITLQPELLGEVDVSHESQSPRCQIICGTVCEQLTCCGKHVVCVYGKNDHSQYDKNYSISSVLFAPQSIPSEPAVANASLYRQVLQLIHQTGQLIDDLSARYFQGLHRYLPICSRSYFYSNVITLGAIPSAEFSVLLLTICLTASAAHADQQCLRRTAHSLLALVQESHPTSIPLIQSRLLLAVYDYTHGRPENAFQAIAGCARMAYAARIHLHQPRESTKDGVSPSTDIKASPDLDGSLRATEAANTWWGIIICERAFFCEVAVTEQPLLTTIPNGDVLLPSEPEIIRLGDCLRQDVISTHEAYIAVSSIGSLDVGGFGRAAQAAWLLDQVFKAFEIPSLHSRLAQLQGLDITIQSFLGVLMEQCYSNVKSTSFCQAIGITIRALFIMHRRIPKQNSEVLDPKYWSLENWRQRSHTVLDTATKMVLDIVEAHINSDFVPPSYSYIIKAALEHIYDKPDWKDDGAMRSAEDQLRITLHHVNQFSKKM
ncbi:unnamed protein product [Penicillium glandicola]